MKFLMILKKEIKQQFRDRQGLVLMILFPLMLTMVLGFSLTSMFEQDTSPSEVSAIYLADTSSELGMVFKNNFAANAEQYNLKLSEETNIDKAKEAVKTGKATCFIHVSSDKIMIYNREGSSFGASLTETILKGFTQTYDAMKVSGVLPGSSDKVFTESVSLTRGPKPRAIDYYAVTMMTLIVMYASMSGISTISDEKRDKTLMRIFCSPTFNRQILIPKVTGVVIATSIQILFVFLIDSLILKVHWGSNLLPVFAILLAHIIMMVSIGVGSAYLFKNSTSGIALIQSIIPFFVFLGGGYVNLEILGITGIMETLTYISPIKWINKTIFQVIYANDFSSFGTTLMICLGISVVFLALSAIISKKELKV